MHFSAQARKKKQTRSKKVLIFFLKRSLCFGKWNFLALRLKQFLYFLKKEAVLIFRETELFKKTSYISEGNFLSSKNKKTHSEKMSYISGNGTFFAPSLKNSYISGGNLKAQA